MIFFSVIIEYRGYNKKVEVGEMFNVLSHSFPYEKVLAKYGHPQDYSFPRQIYVTEQLIKRNVPMNVPLYE